MEIIFGRSISFIKKEPSLLFNYNLLLNKILNSKRIAEKEKSNKQSNVKSHNPLKDFIIKSLKSKSPKIAHAKGSDASKKIKKVGKKSSKEAEPKKVEIIIVDDNEMFLDSLVKFFENKGKVVHGYYNPERFLESVFQYDKDTRICMDYDFGKYVMNGVDLAKKLYEKGYNKLYLLSSKNLEDVVVPEYLAVISKSEIDKLYNLVDVLQKNLHEIVFQDDQNQNKPTI